MGTGVNGTYLEWRYEIDLHGCRGTPPCNTRTVRTDGRNSAHYPTSGRRARLAA